MQTYSQLLQLCRSLNGITQQEFVERLAHFSDHFIDLNTTTMSRWETGKTIPGLQKRKALFHYIFTHHDLDNPTCLAYIRKAYESLVEPVSKVLDNKYNGIVNSFPPFKVDKKAYNFCRMKQCPDNKLSYIIDLEVANHPDHYYNLTIPLFREWCTYESSFCLTCELEGEHLGHIIMLKIDSRQASQLINNQKSIFSLTQKDLLPSSQKGDYLVHTFFGVNAEVVAMLTIKALLFLLEHRTEVENIVTFITREKVLKLAELYGHKIVNKGFNTKNNYRWYSTETPLEEILFSNMIVRMLFR